MFCTWKFTDRLVSFVFYLSFLVYNCPYSNNSLRSRCNNKSWATTLLSIRGLKYREFLTVHNTIVTVKLWNNTKSLAVVCALSLHDGSSDLKICLLGTTSVEELFVSFNCKYIFDVDCTHIVSCNKYENTKIYIIIINKFSYVSIR